MSEGPPEKPKPPQEESIPEQEKESPKEAGPEGNGADSAEGSAEEREKQIRENAIAAANALGGFVVRARLRRRSGMDPMMSETLDQHLEAAARELHASAKDSDGARIRAALISVAEGLNQVDKQQRSGQLIDSSRNIRDFNESLRPLYRSMAAMEGHYREGGMEDEAELAAQIVERTKKISELLIRFYEAVARYERG